MDGKVETWLRYSFNGNVIWEKVGKLKLQDMLGIFENLRTNLCKYLRCKYEKKQKTCLQVRLNVHCLRTFCVATQEELAWL